MDDTGLSNEDVDRALGHFNATKILGHYRSHGRRPVARRIGPLTKPGIEVLSEAVGELLRRS